MESTLDLLNPTAPSLRGLAQACRRSAVLPALALACAWSAHVAGAKALGDEGAPPAATLLAIHVLIAPAFAAALARRGGRARPTQGELGILAAASLLGNVLSLGAELAAAPHLSCSALSFVGAMSPVFTALLALVARAERVRARSGTAVLLGLGAVLVTGRPGESLPGASLAWTLVACASPLGFAGMLLLLASPRVARLGPLQVASCSAVLGLACSLPLALAEGRLGELPGLLARAPLSLLGCAGAMLAEYALLALLTRRGGAVYASSADYLALALGLIWSCAWFGEPLRPDAALACALCLGALGLAKRPGGATAVPCDLAEQNLRHFGGSRQPARPIAGRTDALPRCPASGPRRPSPTPAHDTP